ncbi:DUF1003 domain-containing protein [uncultured Cytophaga sp.]|uniref:DUF1003 domain-containing protein n=1 Tax=uncultured Cytophaga sp. TaxID=160238 RepID=UPI00260DD062|nr:DUF1003 domain-containing protein [uncultured Cytophaga sp.]
MSKNIDDLLKSEAEKLSKLKQIVQQAIDEEKLIVESLLHQPKEVLNLGQRISDRVASFGGSWKFIISFSIILTCWILFNSLAPNKEDFDPYPFILMNLVLSTVAAFQAPIIMMSQNRKEEKDRKRTENDHLINLKAELEVRSLHQKVDLLLEEQIQILFEMQAEQLIILKNIDTKLEIK